MANGKGTSGAVTGATAGATAGTAIAPGIGTAWGAAIGAAAGLVSGLMQSQAEEEELRRKRKYEGQMAAFETQKQGVAQGTQGEQNAYAQMMNDFKSAYIR